MIINCFTLGLLKSALNKIPNGSFLIFLKTIVLDSAYHGHLSSLIDLSPYKHNSKGGSGPPDFVHTVPLPDPFRGVYRGNNCSIDYINQVKKIIKIIKNKGNQLSAFFVEALMGCGGQIILPDRFLKESFKLVHEAGGVCIADEVQIGFGRVGSNYWGFELVMYSQIL